MLPFINTVNEHSYKRVLDSSNELEYKVFSETKLNDTCPITMRKFRDTEIVACLPCNHVFDPTAIEKWVFTRQANCPICRYQLKNTKEIEDTIEYAIEDTIEYAIEDAIEDIAIFPNMENTYFDNIIDNIIDIQIRQNNDYILQEAIYELFT